MKKLTTATSVEAAKPVGKHQVEYPDSKVRGLALRVTPLGGKSWTLRYRNTAGKQRRLGLGAYPAVDLATARGEALAVLGSVAKGLDPAGIKRAFRASASAPRVASVGELIERYLRDGERGKHRPNARMKRTRTLALERYYFARHIKPALGNLDIPELTRSLLQSFLDDVGDGAPSTARQCRAVIRQAYNYAIRREIAEANPAQLMELPAPGQRDRVLSDPELRLIWTAADPDRGGLVSPGTALAIRLAMLTLQRGGEVVGLHASEIDEVAQVWTIPGYRTKNHRTHAVPLSDAAMETIRTAFTLTGSGPSEFGFPSPRSPEKPIRRDALTLAVRRLTRRHEIKDATAHDFRRTGASNLTRERIGVSRFLVSRVLNQLSDSGGAAAVTAVYDRNSYLAEKRQALDAWAALLKEIVSGESRGSNVTAISAARA